MDRSETYIEMCEKAEEIQRQWASDGGKEGDWYTPRETLYDRDWGGEWHIKKKPPTPEQIRKAREEGSAIAPIAVEKGHVYCAGSDGYDGFCTVGLCDWCGGLYDFSLVIWLPRQDQLQEMVGGVRCGFIDFPTFLAIFYTDDSTPSAHLNKFKSWEQLWLAFVMKEKYNKIWDGTNWKET